MASCRCCAVLLLAALITFLLGVIICSVTRTTELDIDARREGVPEEIFEAFETFEASLKRLEAIRRTHIKISANVRSGELPVGADVGNEEMDAGADGGNELALEIEPGRAGKAHENLPKEANESSLRAGGNEELHAGAGGNEELSHLVISGNEELSLEIEPGRGNPQENLPKEANELSLSTSENEELHMGAGDNEGLSLDIEPEWGSPQESPPREANRLSLITGGNRALSLGVGQGVSISNGPTPKRKKPKRYKVTPDLLAYDEGRVVDEGLFDAYQEARYGELRAYLEVIKRKLKAKKLTVSFYPNRKELEPIKKAFINMGAKIEQLGKGGNTAEKSKSDLVVVYSYVAHKYQDRLNAGKHALVLEQPFLRPREFLPTFQTQVVPRVHRSYTWDGNNYRGMHPQPSKKLSAQKRWGKFSKHVRLKGRGGIENATRAVIFGQLETDSTQVPIRRRYGSSNAFYQWAADEVKRLAPHLQVVFKAHPREMKRAKKYFVPEGAVDASKKDLKQVLSNAAVAIVANSNAGLIAMGWGIPVLALDPGFMGWRCSMHNPEDLRRLVDLAKSIDQSKCMHEVALGQWAYSEVQDMLSIYLSPNNYRYDKELMPRISSGRAAPAQASGGRTAPAQAAGGRAAPAQAEGDRAAPAQAEVKKQHKKRQSAAPAEAAGGKKQDIKRHRDGVLRWHRNKVDNNGRAVIPPRPLVLYPPKPRG